MRLAVLLPGMGMPWLPAGHGDALATISYVG
jgi:hypothetical protein